MTHGSLFSGIGGFDLASDWMGWTNVFNCEIDEFCRKILNYYWPDAESFKDIKDTDFTKFRGKIDILTGGFPCQGFSYAGKRKGKDDDRYLWPEMLRVIRQIKPTWVVGENVPGIINLALDTVLTDLENEGYTCQTFNIPACAVNAPHRRARIWVIAYSNKSRRKELHTSTKSNKENIYNRDVMYSYRTIKQREYFRQKKERQSNRSDCRIGINNFQNFPTQSPICSRDDGVSIQLDNITFPKWRNESIKAYGNAVVPILVYEIFKIIEHYEYKQCLKNNLP